jgi:hypothetical protein
MYPLAVSLAAQINKVFLIFFFSALSILIPHSWLAGWLAGWLGSLDVPLGALREVSDLLVVVRPVRVEVPLAVDPRK